MWPNDKLSNSIDPDDIAGEVRKRGVQRRQTRRVIRPKSMIRTVHRKSQRRDNRRNNA